VWVFEMLDARLVGKERLHTISKLASTSRGRRQKERGARLGNMVSLQRPSMDAIAIGGWNGEVLRSWTRDEAAKASLEQRQRISSDSKRAPSERRTSRIEELSRCLETMGSEDNGGSDAWLQRRDGGGRA